MGRAVQVSPRGPLSRCQTEPPSLVSNRAGPLDPVRLPGTSAPGIHTQPTDGVAKLTFESGTPWPNPEDAVLVQCRPPSALRSRAKRGVPSWRAVAATSTANDLVT